MTGLFDAAEEYESQGDLERATLEYDRLVNAGFGDAEALVKKAALHGQRGELKQALSDLQRAEVIAPNDPWPKLRLGQIASTMGRNIAAAEYMRGAVAAAPWSDEMRVNLTAAYTLLGWYDLAFHTALKLGEDLPDWWASARLRGISDYKSRRTEALALLRRWRQTKEVSRDICWHLCNHFFGLGRLNLARRLCDYLIHDGPTSHPPFYLMSRIIARISSPEEAVNFLKSSTNLPETSAEYQTSIAKLLHEAGRFEEVLEVLNGVDIGVEPEEIRYAKAIAMFFLGEDEKLKTYCIEWMRLSPQSVTPAGFISAAFSRRTRPLQSTAVRSPRALIKKTRIMQFWDKKPIPDDVRKAIATWTRLHPAVEHTVFDEAKAGEFLSAHFGSYALDSFNKCYHVAMKVDYFRIAFLYKEGGIYVDADEICIRPMDAILDTVDSMEIIASLSGNVPGYIHNTFIGARSGGKIMHLALEDASAEIQRAAHESRRPSIWNVTGPGLITRAVGRYIANEATSTTPDEIWLMPLQQYHSFARTDGSLAYKRDETANWRLAELS